MKAPPDAVAAHRCPSLSCPQNFVRKSENDKDLQKLLKQVDYWMNQAGVPEKQRVMEWAALEEIECLREQDETRE